MTGKRSPITPIPEVVISDTESVVPHGYGAGKKTSTIRTLTLASGKVIFKCSECGYWAEKYASVMSHRTIHSGKERKSPVASGHTQKALLPIWTAALGRLHQEMADAVQAQTELTLDWRARALKAEAELESLRRKVKRLMQIGD